MHIRKDHHSSLLAHFRFIAIATVMTLGLRFTGNIVSADEPALAPEFPLRVEVRTIRAEGKFDDGNQTPAPQALEGGITDLSSQLERLPYSRFRLVDLQTLVLPPRKRRKLALADGHQITLRPVAVDGENICLWLKWKDKVGTQLLDTRVRFVTGESMLTGTEHTPEVGLILAIKVEPVQ